MNQVIGKCLSRGLAIGWLACLVSIPTLRAARPAPHHQRLRLGVDVNLFNRNLGFSRMHEVFALIHVTGARYVRVGAGGWAKTEPQPGRYDFRATDRVIRAAQAQGLQVMLEVGDSVPAWDLPAGAHTRHGWVTYAPADCTGARAQDGRQGITDCGAFGQYIHQLAAHVKPLGVRYLIMWNEPQNYPKNWIPAHGATAAQNARAFARLLYAAYIQAHAADPHMHILNGGTEVFPHAWLRVFTPYIRYPKLARAQLHFIHTLYRDPEFCRGLDVLDIHVGVHGPYWSSRIVRASELALQRCNGGHRVPVWVTECAYSSRRSVQRTGASPIRPPLLAAMLGSGYDQGERSQARYLLDTYRALAAMPYVVGINWTAIADPPPGPGAGLGLVGSHLQRRKPAFYALWHWIHRRAARLGAKRGTP